MWAHPDLLPDSSDLDNPTAFVDRVIGGGTGAFEDPIAQLQATMEREQAERDRAAEDGSDEDRPGDDSTS